MTKARTPDERFIICLHEAGSVIGELDRPFDRYEIGKKAGISAKGVEAICKLLLQANFIRRGEINQVYLTKNGEDLALEILRE